MLSEYMAWIIKEEKSDNKVIVHCSAGVGRTGTTLCIAQLIIKLYAQKNSGVKRPMFSIFETIK